MFQILLPSRHLPAQSQQKKHLEQGVKLTIKTPERLHWHRSDVAIANFEHISHLVLIILLLTLNM